MSETNKSYRIRTNVGSENKQEYITVNADLIQDYDTFEVLSVNIKSKDTYQLHNSNYGVVVGRVIANNGFGIPNAKVSIFIEADLANGMDIGSIYPFNSSIGKDKNGVRYNLLPNERVDGCHQVVGTFPTKRYALDNDVILEVFDHYYTYTTKTNNAGDYMICGVPTGAHTIHMDLDLSDCGILSQKPRDFVYKGYTIEQFETPTKFKGGTDYNNLSQIFSQDQVVNVNPFWGNSDLGETIGLSRCDIDVNFKFEPTCVFMGSIVSDNNSNGFSKKCVPTDAMGYMDELVTGEGKIEMIRKTPGGSVEEFQIKGNKLINANGVWCYQIPMNLDYMVTDEYGNMVPTDNPDKGIPTRASVRFRISMEDSEDNPDNFFRAKVLVPHNPKDYKENYDYEFGSYTKDESFRDLYWNNVYSVKSYIPRIQKNNNWRKEKFSGIKHCNKFGPNNPMPYNNIRIKLPLMFTIMCAILKTFIFLVKVTNTIITIIGWIFAWIGTHFRMIYIEFPTSNCNCTGCWPVCWLMEKRWWPGNWKMGRRCLFRGLFFRARKMHLIVLKDGLCPDLENWFFAPMYTNIVCRDASDEDNCLLYYDKTCSASTWFGGSSSGGENDEGEDAGCTCSYESDDENLEESGSTSGANAYNILLQTIRFVTDETDGIDADDTNSIDDQNADPDDETHCLTTNTDYLLPCVEMNLAMEYNVINFDFYNDWINGVIYNPRWVRFMKKKVRFLWITWAKEKIKGCMDDTKTFHKQRKYVQQCAIGYGRENVNGYEIISKVDSPINTMSSKNDADAILIANNKVIKNNNFHKKSGFRISRVFGENGGVCHEGTTLKGQKVYYLKPCEFSKATDSLNRKTNLYATDIILLGTFNDCDLNGIPKTFTHLTSTTYIMPTNLALTNMDTNGPLYATNAGTICMGSSTHQGTGNSGETLNQGIREIDITNGKIGPLGKEIEYYQNSNNYDIRDKSFFNDMTENDTIALTEAAGISWDWTGPGQGQIVKERMYYPGGHFLGLTCVNSQTNLKSCLNLSRICEIGTNMSQRHEEVRSISENGLKYTYTVPSGFISGDEISDADFRAMFATLNKKRLIATKRNLKTGYKFYDFEFAQPINFDGAFSDVVYGDYLHHTYTNSTLYNKRPYNENIPVVDEDLSLFGILKSALNPENDQEETGNTQTRTRELTSIDYYTYRFGLEYNNFTINDVKKKFLISETKSGATKYYLPQYENSFYFYFGLKQGATALDEFNKQFYAECDEIKLKNSPRLILASEINFCEAKGNLHIITEGLSTPYQYVMVDGINDDFHLYINVQSNEHEIQVLSMESFFYPDEHGDPYELPFGRYKVTIMDDDDVELSEIIDIGSDLFRYDLTTVNFTKPITQPIVGNNLIYNGGFVLVENFSCLYETEENVEYQFMLSFNGVQVGSYEYIENVGHLVYGENINVDYDLYVMWRCGSGEFNSLKIDTISFKDNSEIDLRIGFPSGSCIYTESCIYNDYMPHMSSEFWFDRNNDDIGAENGLDTIDKWFFRRMFFKESNFSSFDSHVFPTGGSRKVLWGPAQQTGNSGVIVVGNDDRIYCSENYLEITGGKYLDDTRTLKPTYGANYCNVTNTENLRSGEETNCTHQYCAQAYKDTDVCGEYRGTYNRTNGVVLNTNYFHEGYGCIFKPLPYGNLLFLTYNGLADLKNRIDFEGFADYGVIYPTFIYPVMKRPFFGDFSVRIYGDFDVNINENYDNQSYSVVNRNMLNNELLKIHNGITYDREFDSIQVYSRDCELHVLSSDTYNITLSNNVDRIHDCSHYESVPECTNGTILYNNVYFGVTEGYPMPLVSGLARTITVYREYSFYNNLYYRYDSDENKIFDIYGDGNTDSDIEYYFGCYGSKDNIDFLIEPSDYADKKYAYSRDSQGNYIALCRFVEDVSIHDSAWYTNVFIKIALIPNDSGRFYLYYSYKDIYGNNQVFDELVSVQEGSPEFGSLTHPHGINAILGQINSGVEFDVYDNEAGSGNEDYYRIVFPFRPVLNYQVLNGDNQHPIVAYNTNYYGPNFKSFIQRMMQKKKLYPIEMVDRLPLDSFYDLKFFGIGVKTIMSDEDNESLSYVYKVYPNPFRHLFYGDTGDYTITIEPTNYNYQTGEMEYTFGKGADGIVATVTVASPCTLRVRMENNQGWCYYVTNLDPNANYGVVTEISYVGQPISYDIHVDKNETNYNRVCSLIFESYYGGIRDTKIVKIKQSNQYLPVDIFAPDASCLAGHHEVPIIFNANGGTEITASTSVNWLTVKQPTSMEIVGNTEYEFTCVTKYNTGATRSTFITLTPAVGEPYNVFFEQAAAFTPPTMTITLNKTFPSPGSGYHPYFYCTVRYSDSTSQNKIREENGYAKVRYHLIGYFDDDMGGGGIEHNDIDDWFEDTLNHSSNGYGVSGISGVSGSVCCDAFEFVNSNLDYKIDLVNNGNNYN